MFQKLHKFISSFNNLSLNLKLRISFTAIIFIVVVNSLSSFYFYRKDKIVSTIALVDEMNNQAISEINNYINDLIRLVNVPYYYDNLNYIKFLSETDFKTADDPTRKNLNNVNLYIAYMKDSIHSSFVFDKNGLYTYTMKSTSLSGPYDFSKEAWFQDAVSKIDSVLLPTHKLPVTDNSKSSSLVFSVAKGLRYFGSNEAVGVILVNSSIDTLTKVIDKMLVYDNQRILIVDDRDYIIYDSNNVSTTNYLNILDSLSPLVNISSSQNLTLDNTDYSITILKSKTVNWKIINCIPLTSLNKNIAKVETRNFTFAAIVIMIILVITLLITNQFITPIKKLSLLMNIVKQGNFSIKAKVNSTDEVGQLASTFNDMTTKIEELIEETYVDKLNQKELELRMLQNQINPHFIYNTLESIRMMCEINDDIEASEMTMALGKILRYGLSNKLKYVTVSQEIDNVKTYVKLQEYRFDNFEKLVFDIDSSLYDNEIVKLTFQPIVENAVYHGLSTLETGGIIVISSYKDTETGDIIFTIKDNGIGMDNDTLVSLNDYINEKNENFNSIGLRNVNMRIKLSYGDNYGIKIYSEKNEGTTVKIKIPDIKSV